MAATSSIELKNEAIRVSEELANSLSAILNAHPLVSIRPTEAARRYGVSQSVMSRVVRATESADPLFRLHQLPGPEPLRRLLRTAKQQAHDPAPFDHAETSVDQFDKLIKTVSQDRSGLDAIISGWVPEVREKTDQQNRQMVFRGMSQLMGASRDASIVMFFLDPTDDQQIRVMVIEVAIGLRRLRPGARIIEGASGEFAKDMKTISGGTVTSSQQLYVDKFCPSPLPFVELSEHEAGDTVFVLGDESLGLRSAVDIAWGFQAFFPSKQAADSRLMLGIEIATAICTPSISRHVYLFVNRSVAHRNPPLFRHYDMTIYGIEKPDEPARELTAIGPHHQMAIAGSNALEVRCVDMPRFDELVAHVCEQSKNDPLQYHCYSLSERYPPVNHSLWLTVDPE